MNADNQGRPPKDWWQAIRDYHGHVGPWNVLGYRIGQRALKEFDTRWGDHSLKITCHTPLRTPYTCIADGLVVGTGNTIGRLDIRLAEVADRAAIRVTIRRIADGKTLVFLPHHTFLARIEKVKPDTLDPLAHECADLPDEHLFSVQ
jgi:formylmethanofuran dehydrogenase subunit E